MADNKQHQIPSTASMAWFAVFLGIVLLSLVLFLQFKFGTPAP